jgi:thymidylate kinase
MQPFLTKRTGPSRSLDREASNNRRIIVFEGIDGAGKSTMLAEIEAALSRRFNVLKERLAPIMVDVFKDLVDEPANEKGKYQDVIPGEFRHASYIIESIVQFKLLDETYRKYDFLLFDRWLHTNEAYLPEIINYREWFATVGEYIPLPDLVFYCRVDPAVAVERLRQREDWVYLKLGEERLRSYLSWLQERYDSLMDHDGVIILDCEKSIAELREQVLETIEEKFSLRAAEQALA